MNAERDNLDSILSELAATRAREQDLLSRMAVLLEAPASAVPDHVEKVFAQAKELSGGEGARFLTTPHWELDHEIPMVLAQDIKGARRVEELLARITYGVPA
jgi:hypothetical protein